ncbi:hypothetical protein JCM3765_007394 [Sporobolomyces pararoseus]
MKSPSVETNSLPPDLAARFAALRSPPTAPRTEQPKDTVKDDLEARLKQLEPPTDTQIAKAVPIEVNDQVSDESVEKFLESLSTEQLELPPSSPPHHHSSSSSTRNRKIPTLTESSLDTLSGIEIEFMKRPQGSTDFSSSLSGGNDEEDELLKKMGDELSVEEKERGRNEGRVEKWEERLNGLKGVVPSSGGGGERIRTSTLGDGPPELGELERELRRRKKREEKRNEGKKGSDDEDSETDSESETTETESEESNEDD